ncbi:MAG: toxin-antitoxin system, toxin component [bacterium]|nr:toxin-antitoxin system, toxin component [bacterium]
MPETFLIDESVDRRILRKLEPLDLNTIFVSVVACGIPDDEVLNLAELHDAILITEDRDFGEWVFAHGRQSVSIIYLRYRNDELDAITEALRTVLSGMSRNLRGKFTVITPKKIRVRELF